MSLGDSFRKNAPSMNEPATRDELFAPSLSQTSRTELPPGEKPWRLNSQFYVAFFGGPLAAGAVGYLNGRRLGVPSRGLVAIGAAGVAGFVLAIVLVATVDWELVRPRIMIAATGVLAFFVARQFQKDADRRYGFGRDVELAYDSLVRTGIVIALAAGIFSALVLAVVVA